MAICYRCKYEQIASQLKKKKFNELFDDKSQPGR